MRPTGLQFVLLVVAGMVSATEVAPRKWSGSLNVPDPVACTVDEAGNVYVSSTARRKAGDVDIREHPLWVPYDLAFTSPDEKAAFYRREITPAHFRAPRGGIKDFNGDGVIDWKDLSFNKDKIYKLSDADGSGVANKITVFADGFNLPNAGIAAGVLYFDGWVYVTAIPHLYRFKDTKGEGVADVQEIVASGFGCHIAYAGHDMHGLRLGPDGRIYWTIGDKGLNVTSQEGRKFFYPHEGAVMRCEPDGANFEVFAHGIRNLQEIAFDDFGNVLGVDNDADQPKERERMVYLLEGSDSGWRCQHQYMKLESRWMKENIWMPAGQPDQPLFITPPIANYSDGPAGFLHEPGHALDGTLRGHFILNQFPKGAMDAFTLEADRDSFRMVGLRTINKGIMGVGMSWGTDGRAYFVDWMGGYPLKQKGAVWRMDVAPQIDVTSEQFLAKPYSAPVPKEELLALLGHRDQRVRTNASIRLDRLGAWDEMLRIAKTKTAPRLGRIHAIWGCGMGLRRGKIAEQVPYLALLDDDDAEIRVQALKVLSEAKVTPALQAKVVGQLAHDDLRVRTQAGITLGRIGGVAPFATFLRDPAADLSLPWLRHGLVSGIAATHTSEQLYVIAQSKPGAEAVFATLALARQKSVRLGGLLDHSNVDVVKEAARAIHDDVGIPEAWGALADVLQKSPLPPPVARRAINTNLRLGTEGALAHLLDWYFVQVDDVALRTQAMQAIISFNQPPVLDRVDGTSKIYPERDKHAIAGVLRRYQARLLEVQEPGQRALVLEAMVKYELDIPLPVLLAFAGDLKASPAVRQQTLRLLGAKTVETESINRILRSSAGEGNPSMVRIEAVNQLFVRDLSGALEVMRNIINSKSAQLPEKQAIITQLRDSADPLAGRMVLELLDRLNARNLDAGLRFDVYLAAHDSTILAVKNAWTKYLATTAKAGLRMASPDLPFELLLDGGDAPRGREIINGHIGANCTACHRVDSDEGSEVGPKLTAIGATRSKADLLESLIEPSAKIVPGFGLETLTLKDGTSLSGNVLNDDGKTLELRTLDGKTRKIKSAIVTARSTPLSIMPPMLGTLSPAEIRDVVAYLSSLKPRVAKSPEAKSKDLKGKK